MTGNLLCGALLCTLICTVCSFPTQTQYPKCPDGWNTFLISNNEVKCTWISTDRTTWIDAMSWCKVFGGELVEIKTALFNFQLVRVLSRRQVTGKYWMGSTDMELEMNYKWMTSGDFTPLNVLNPGQMQSTTAKNCVATDENANWSVEDCATPLQFICQKSFQIGGPANNNATASAF